MSEKIKLFFQGTRLIVLSAIAFILAVATIFMITRCSAEKKRAEKQPVIVNTSSLKEVIEVSKLSTFEMIYNGVAEVHNADNPDKTDFYVSYKSRVRFGFDFSKIGITSDDEAKTITVTFPGIDTPEVNVDIESLEFIFVNKKSDTPTVAQRAYGACIDDAEHEVKSDTIGKGLAKTSAEKAVRENLDILSQKNILATENHRILVEDTDEGEVLRERVHDLKQLVTAYQLGWITETRCEDHVW